MNIARLTTVRNVLRTLGINKLLTLPATLRARREINTYRKSRPAFADIDIEGFQIKLHVNDEQEWLRARSLMGDQHILKAILEHLPQGAHYWDIGASIGGYTVLMSKAVGQEGRVISFEPEPRSFEKLLSNIKLNTAANVSPYQAALGAKRETLSFQPAINASEGTHHLVSGTADDDAPKVDVYPMDEFRKLHGLQAPTVMKIDVEGWEEQVLLGGKQTLADPGCHAVIVEVHFSILAKANDNGAPARIQQLLQDCHFTALRWIDPSHLIATK
jgi:FkbM family methyltransferase